MNKQVSYAYQHLSRTETKLITKQNTKLVLTEQWEKARKPLKILGKTGVMR